MYRKIIDPTKKHLTKKLLLAHLVRIWEVLVSGRKHLCHCIEKKLPQLYKR